MINKIKYFGSIYKYVVNRFLKILNDSKISSTKIEKRVLIGISSGVRI